MGGNVMEKFRPHFLELFITGCAVAQHCCNDDQQSQWENGDFDPCRSETPENVITKIGHIDYVAGATRVPNFMVIGLGVSAPRIAKYNVL